MVMRGAVAAGTRKCNKSNIKSEKNTTMFTIGTKNAIAIYAMSRYWATLSSCRKGGAHIFFIFIFFELLSCQLPSQVQAT